MMIKSQRGVLFVSLLLLLALFILPFASAKITIVNSFQDMYNVGDTVLVDGYIVTEITADATASLELQCPGYSKVNSVNLQINKGKKVTFEGIGIASFVLPSTVEGTCDIEATFNGESTNSDSFTVLNDLLGSFDVTEDEYQLGNTLRLTGIVFKLDGSDVTGIATIYMKKAGSYAIQIDSNVAVQNGALDYSKQLADWEYGQYYIDVKVEDGIGNSQYFENVDSFDLVTSLVVHISANTYQYEPGEEIVISGEIETDNEITNPEVSILFDTLKYSTIPSGKTFEYRFFVPKNMNSGSYLLTVTVEDEYGNVGSDELTISIKQIATIIVNELEEESYAPGDTLSFNINLYDQSGKEIIADVSLVIADPQGGQLYNGIVSTGNTVAIEFGRYSAPGMYTLTSQYTPKALQDSDTIEVIEVKQLSTEISGSLLTIQNTGNVLYDERVDLILTTEEDGKKRYYVLAETVYLEPGEIQTIDLSYEVPEGEYTVFVDESPTDLSSVDDEQLLAHVITLGENPGNVYSGIVVAEDNRPLGKKVDQGFSTITGATTISSYNKSVTPWFLFLVFIIFVGLIGLYGYQQRAVLAQTYQNYKKKIEKRAEEKGGFLSTMRYRESYRDDVPEGQDGDISEEEVAKMLAEKGIIKDQGLTEKKTETVMRVTGVKPGTTTIVYEKEERIVEPKQSSGNKFSTMGRAVQPIEKPVAKPKFESKLNPITGKKVSRFSTWSPPAETLDEKSFPAKNPVKESSVVSTEKEKALYDDIDEEFLRDEKF